MAYTYHTVQSASRELENVQRVLAAEERRLKAARARTGKRFGTDIRKQEDTVSILRHRRDFLAGELEKARENERLGIPPLGPQPTWRK